MNNMDKITEKVFLGDFMGAANEEALLKNNIKRVFSCNGDLSPKYKDKSIVQKIIQLEDSPRQNIMQYFVEAIKFIEESNKVFVHCFAGVSRSATLVIAYFMWKDRKGFDDCFNKVNEKRFIGPNFGFRQQLAILDKKLKENGYNLDKIKFDDVKWPPEGGIMGI